MCHQVAPPSGTSELNIWSSWSPYKLLLYRVHMNTMYPGVNYMLSRSPQQKAIVDTTSLWGFLNISITGCEWFDQLQKDYTFGTTFKFFASACICHLQRFKLFMSIHLYLQDCLTPFQNEYCDAPKLPLKKGMFPKNYCWKTQIGTELFCKNTVDTKYAHLNDGSLWMYLSL